MRLLVFWPRVYYSHNSEEGDPYEGRVPGRGRTKCDHLGANCSEEECPQHGAEDSASSTSKQSSADDHGGDNPVPSRYPVKRWSAVDS